MAIKFNNVNYLDKINDFNYEFIDNNITFVIGKSGSGKTLLSYLMLGLVSISSGNIQVFNDFIDKDTKNFNSIRRNIGYVFKDPAVEFFENNVRMELEFGLRHHNYKINKIDTHIINALKMVGLSESYLAMSPFDLSKGEQVKLAIAIALSLNPKIIILDEPTIFLDNKSKIELINLLRLLKNKYNKTIIINSNDIDFVINLADKIILLNNGKIYCDMDSNNIINNIDKLKKCGMEMPKIIEFIDKVNKYKHKKYNYTLDINELVSEINNDK